PGVDYDRVIASAHYAARQNPAILECTSASIIDAVSRVLMWGLEIGLTAHLVPFNTNIGTKEKPKWAKICTPIADYTGLAQLMVDSGAVRHVETRVVYEHDDFRYSYGLDSELYHVPTKDAAKRGKMVAAYCILRLPFGASSFEVMPVEDIEAIRQGKSKQWKNGALPAWYAKKTVVRQSAKLVPKNRKMAQALRVVNEDEDQEFSARLDTPQMRAALAAGEQEDTPSTPGRTIHNTGVAKLQSGNEYGLDPRQEVAFENADEMVEPSEPADATDDNDDSWMVEQDEREETARRTGRNR
ncbi:MAG TPA: recombinase RecT, partial [Gemmatimonadaceae bacterium]|nr:recombinase RecT [Gemmatimonadaceae bacterium]